MMKAVFQPKFWHHSLTAPWLETLYRSRLFWIVLAFKLTAGTFLASAYLSELFIPFLEQFARHPFENPYHVFWTHAQERSFPYPALMLYLMALPRLLTAFFWGNDFSLFAQFFIYRLPLLLADLLILVILMQWLPRAGKRVILLYWAAPALFYITYMHGQLDVVPIALLFLSLFFLFRDKWRWAAIFLGFAIATKTHIAIALPFFFINIYQRDRRPGSALAFTALAGAAFLVPNLPYIADPGFIQMVFRNAEQGKIFQIALPFSSTAHFYVIPALYLFLLFRALRIPVLNRDLFLFLLGFSFGALVFFIAPMPGWYYWTVPLFAYFFAKAPRSRRQLLLIALQGAYLLYFALIPESDYVRLFSALFPGLETAGTLRTLVEKAGLDPVIATNCAFTLMQAALLGTCLWIYRQGIRNALRRKLGALPYFIGVSGDSGSGKSTLAQELTELFGPKLLTVICGDDQHKWQRGSEHWEKLTHLDPRANRLHQELETIRALRQGRPILRRHYDHDTGAFTEPQQVSARPLVVMEGLHTFFLKPVRAFFDLKIFVRPDPDLLKHWKIARDMVKRGYTKEAILAALAKRAHDSEKYIRVQEQNADIIVAYRLRRPLAALGDSAEAPELYLSLNVSNHFNFDTLIDDLQEVLGDDIRHAFDAQDRQIIDVYATIDGKVLQSLAEKHLEGLQNLGLYQLNWKEGWSGVLQLFLAYCISYEGAQHVDS